jgi:hypothetical protein
MSYSNGMATSFLHGETNSWRYHVIQHGADFVVIKSAMSCFPNPKIHFVDNGRGYWVDAGNRYQEYFDKILLC